jgi:hypothetical protein
MWSSHTIFWYGTAIKNIGHVPLPMTLLMVLFPIGHVAVGFYIVYDLLCGFANRTDAMISPAGVKCRTGPLPRGRNQDLRAGEIHDIKVRERQARRGDPSYSLMYVDAANKERTLVKGMPHRDQAEFIEVSIREVVGVG